MTKICPSCGKLMIERQSPWVLTTDPPIYQYQWWCGCGHTEFSREERGVRTEDLWKKEWEQLNKEDSK